MWAYTQVGLCSIFNLLCYRDPAEAGIDLFEDIIKNMYQLADAEGRGYITKEEFLQVKRVCVCVCTRICVRESYKNFGSSCQHGYRNEYMIPGMCMRPHNETIHPLIFLLQLLQSEQMIAYLNTDDVEQMQQYFAAIPSGQATYLDFYPMAKELILRVYRVKDPSEVRGRHWLVGSSKLVYFCPFSTALPPSLLPTHPVV